MNKWKQVKVKRNRITIAQARREVSKADEVYASCDWGKDKWAKTMLTILPKYDERRTKLMAYLLSGK